MENKKTKLKIKEKRNGNSDRIKFYGFKKKLGRGFSVCFPCFKNRSLYSSQFAQKNEAMVWIKQL